MGKNPTFPTSFWVWGGGYETYTHRIHGAGIFTFMYHKHQPNVGKYTIPGSYGIYFWVFKKLAFFFMGLLEFSKVEVCKHSMELEWMWSLFREFFREALHKILSYLVSKPTCFGECKG